MSTEKKHAATKRGPRQAVTKRTRAKPKAAATGPKPVRTRAGRKAAGTATGRKASPKTRKERGAGRRRTNSKQQNKTQPTAADVAAFVAKIPDPERRAEAEKLIELMRGAVGAEPVLWGKDIVGFGRYHYRYASGREGDWFLAGFSPRKRALSIYVCAGFDRFPELMERLGRFTTGKACLYAKRLSDLHLPALRQLIRRSAALLKRTQPAD